MARFLLLFRPRVSLPPTELIGRLDPLVLRFHADGGHRSPAHLRADDFEGFMKERRRALLALVSEATGHLVSDVADEPEEGEEVSDDLARDSGLTPAIA